MTWENSHGAITNSDLEMVAEFLGCLVLEENVPRRRACGTVLRQLGTVSWQMRGASRRSVVANGLLRVLPDPLGTTSNVTSRRTGNFSLALTKNLCPARILGQDSASTFCGTAIKSLPLSEIACAQVKDAVFLCV